MLGHARRVLSAPRTSLIGREQEVAETRELVLRGPERLITLTGVGGCGKTRLALQVASEARTSFPDGAWLVELAPVSDPHLMPEAVAAALGVADPQNDGLLEALSDSLHSRKLLLLLDNCEHIIEACARLADHLLAACPDLRVLATSREPLQIAGERQCRVLPLAIPSPSQAAGPDELLHCPSVQLFVERARAVEPGFQLTSGNAADVARICTLLGGIPLALELAAARVRVLSPRQIVERLDDCFRLLVGSSRSAPTRQQTLKAALDWSYDHLSPTEQIAFRALAVFAGGFSLEAAEAVCSGEELAAADVLDVLTRLVDKSLVLVDETSGEARYHLLEPVRQYGERLLKTSGEAEAVQGRHAAYYVALAERAEAELQGPRQAEWLGQLDGELGNIRAAERRATARGDRQTPLRLAGTLYWFLWMRHHLHEGVRWLGPTLVQTGDAGQPIDVPPRVWAKGVFVASWLHMLLGDYSRAQTYGWEALRLCREVGDAFMLGMATSTLSHIVLEQGDTVTARALADEGIAFARESGSLWLQAHASILLGQVVHREGDTRRSVALHEQARDLFRKHGDGWGVAYATAALGALAQEASDVLRAAALSGIRTYWERRDYPSLAAALEYLAGLPHPGHAELPVITVAVADSLRKTLDIPAPLGERDDLERHLEAARAELGEGRFSAAWAEGRSLRLDQAVARVLGESQPAVSSQPSASASRKPGPSDELTRREREVAVLVARGYTDRQIADELTITEGTAGLHVHHILEKLRLRSRVQVADWALANGLIDSLPE